MCALIGLRTFDALIAAIAIENGFTFVPKNRKHFQGTGELKLKVPASVAGVPA